MVRVESPDSDLLIYGVLGAITEFSSKPAADLDYVKHNDKHLDVFSFSSERLVFGLAGLILADFTKYRQSLSKGVPVYLATLTRDRVCST